MTDDNLPPLPQPEFDNLLDHIYEYGTLAEGTIPRARALCEAYARAAILAERERGAKVCAALEADAWATYEKIRSAYTEGRADGMAECAAAIREGVK